jgi:hypothetical protein
MAGPGTFFIALRLPASLQAFSAVGFSAVRSAALLEFALISF